jgi:WD40 repeat protein
LHVRAWPLGGGPPRVERLHGGTPGKLAFAPGGERLLVAGQWNVFVGIYDARELSFVSMAPASPANLVTSLVASPDGRTALCASKDGKVNVFSVDPPRLDSVITASAAVLDARFSPDGASIITAAVDGTVRIWPVDPLPVAKRHRALRDWPRGGER